MKLRFSSVLLLFLVLGLVISGCGQAQGASPQPKTALSPVLQATPTPTPEPGFYRDENYGFSLRFPKDWPAKKGKQAPLVEIRAPQGSPVVRVYTEYLPQESTLQDYASQAIAGWQGDAPKFTLVRQGELSLAEGGQGYEVEFTWLSGNAPARGRLLFVLRRDQAFQIHILAPEAEFQRQREAIGQILLSFRLEEPRPFGLPRSQALTLYDEGPYTLDPALSRELRSHSYIFQVFSGLVAFNSKLELVPDLAERWESTDGQTFTFYLRRGVRFHSGRELKASDVKYSWERAARPETGSQTAATYLGDIVGVKEVLESKAREISGVKALDDYTLQVTIDAPKAYFLAKLTYPVALVVNRANVESGKEWWRRPDGTGPYRLQEWQPDELLILQRNPNYYGQPAKVEHIVFRLFGGIPMMMYETGDIDAVGVGGANLERVLDEANPLNKELRVVPELSLYYLGFNHTRPPFDDPLVRQAFALAVDKDKIIGRVHNKTVDKANGILPPGLPGVNPNIKPLSYDPARARALLAASKYKGAAGLPPITLTAAGEGGEVSQALSAIAHQWQENLGVHIRVRLLEPKLYFYRLKEEKDEIFDTGWIADYPDPQNFVDILFHTGSEENSGGYSNPTLDALLDKAAVEIDATRRRQLYWEAEQKLVDEAVIIPLWFNRNYSLVKPYVQGYEVTPLGIPWYGNVSLSPH